MKVKDIMYTQLYFIEPTASVQDAALMMAGKKVGSLLVKKGNDIVGIVTQGDIVERVVATGKAGNTIQVNTIKNSPLIMIDQDTDIFHAADVLTKYKVRRLMVVHEGKIVGILSTKVIGAHLQNIVNKNYSIN